MKRPKVISVIGTRPEAIKMAPVMRLLNAQPELHHLLVVTAQHRALLDDVLNLFEFEPAHDLGLMIERQSLEHITSHALSGLAEILRLEAPDFVLVHGDTTTTFAAALAAFYAHVPVGHVEAGLRTSDRHLPFPEELNRRLTDLIADHYYCPTSAAAQNLAYPEHGGRTFITGNTALDAIRLVYQPAYDFPDPVLSEFTSHAGPKLLLTTHRRENWGQPLSNICRGLLDTLEDHPSARSCCCWHPNPVVRDTVGPLLGNHPRILLTDPPRFDVFANLMARVDLLLTDSGGIQEEVTALGKYTLVLRRETERPEAVAAGFARVVGTDALAIRQAAAEVLDRCVAGELPGDRRSPFGDGQAAVRIEQAVCWALGLAPEPPANYISGQHAKMPVE